MNCTKILEYLYVGSHPGTLSDIEMLKDDCGTRAVLNLQTDEDFVARGLDWSALDAAYRNLDVMAIRIRMRDFDYDDQRRVLRQAVKALARLLALGHTVYLHCNVGLGRSPLVAMAYLYWWRFLSLEEAIGHVEERRPCSPMIELLEVTRQDLLQNEKLRKHIALHACELSRQRQNQPADPFRDWVDGEREILKEVFCQDYGDVDKSQHVVAVCNEPISAC
jgi:hypothetical protein